MCTQTFRRWHKLHECMREGFQVEGMANAKAFRWELAWHIPGLGDEVDVRGPIMCSLVGPCKDFGFYSKWEARERIWTDHLTDILIGSL